MSHAGIVFLLNLSASTTPDMSPSPEVPIIAVQAIQQKRYAEAIPYLEAFCHNSPASGKNYFQAQVWLVKAYKATNQPDRAIALCQQMLKSSHAKIQAWAQQALASLEPGLAKATPIEPEPEPAYPSLTPEESIAMLEAGNRALKQGQYAVAVETLELVSKQL